MKEDTAEMRAMAYAGAMIAQTLGRAMNGTPLTAGHIKDMDSAARLIADQVVTTMAEMGPKKGK